MSKYLTRDRILAVQDFATEVVDVPEWGGQVLVRELSASEVEKIGFDMATPDGGIDARKARGIMAQVVAWATIDEGNEPIFTKNDLRELGKKSYPAIQRIASTIMRLSGLSAEEKEEAEAEGAETKN
jgi:hypothetical protein